jgi:hypothetical protein
MFGNSTYEHAQKDWQKSTDAAPPDMQKIMKAMKLGSAGNDITIDASVPEVELGKLIPGLIKAL